MITAIVVLALLGAVWLFVNMKAGQRWLKWLSITIGVGLLLAATVLAIVEVMEMVT